MRNITSKDVRKARSKLKMSVIEFAYMLQVHIVTVYRYQSTEGEIGIDHGFQRMMLEALLEGGTKRAEARLWLDKWQEILREDR